VTDFRLTLLPFKFLGQLLVFTCLPNNSNDRMMRKLLTLISFLTIFHEMIWLRGDITPRVLLTTIKETTR